MTVSLPVPDYADRSSIRKFVLRHTYAILAVLASLLLTMICADGISRHLDRVFPELYRHTASLSIAISELSYGTRGFIGLANVTDTLVKGGLTWMAETDRVRELSHNPQEFDQLLATAGHISNVDRSNTMVLHANETGMIDYYLLALSIFGYHIVGFYLLFIVLIACVVGCFLISFRAEPAFIIPCILWLLVLLLAQHHIDPAELLKFGTPANARFLPMVSILPVLFVLALSASGQRVGWLGAAAATVAALVYGLCETTRSSSIWQFGAVIALMILIISARCLPRWRLRVPSLFARHALWPLAVFAVTAIGWVTLHHARRDTAAYADSTFMGHPYWLNYIGSTQDAFASRIPEFEKRSGITIGSDADSYTGALVRIKIKERGGRVGDYLIDDYSAPFFNEEKRESIARQIAFDFWRQYPLTMLSIHLHAFEPIWNVSLPRFKAVAIAGIALLAVPWTLSWILMIAAGAIAALHASELSVATLIALALYAVLPPPVRTRAWHLVPSSIMLTGLVGVATVANPDSTLIGLEDQYYVVWYLGLLFLIVAPWDLWRRCLKDAAVGRLPRSFASSA